VVKSHSRVLKFLVEFNEVCKTGFESKMYTLSGDIGIFLGQSTQNLHFFNNREFQSKNLLKVWDFFGKPAS
jgi:hypothetical protein